MKRNLATHTDASRRDFLKQLSGGVLLTSLGAGLAGGLGVASPLLVNLSALGEGLDLGSFARLADLVSQTPLGALQPALVKEVRAGTTLAQLIAAAALANARAFGGEDYIGYHVFMALMPAFEISQAMSGDSAILPVLKVLYRNSARMQAGGFDRGPRLTSPPPSSGAKAVDGEFLLSKVHEEDMGAAEAAFSGIVKENLSTSFDELIPVVCQEVDVHRVVLAWRGWDLLRLTGKEHAQTLLRQSIRQCVDREAANKRDPIRAELPAVLRESRVLDSPAGTRVVDSAWIEACAEKLTNATRKEGACLIADALNGGVTEQALGEALSLASTFLMLRQEGLRSAYPGKPIGSVHGAGTGVHSSDTAAAWRGMARFGTPRQRKLALVAGGYHVAGQSGNVLADMLDYGSEVIDKRDPQSLLGQLSECLQTQDQAGAAAAAATYAEETHPLGPMLALLLDSSVAAEGALHAEKYYRTQVEAIEGDRPAFRPLHLAALARVCASQSGELAAGREQALGLL